VRDAAARPIELVSVHPNRVKIKVNKGEKFYTVDDKKTYSDEEMLHFVGLSFDGVKGQSPLDALRDAIGMGIAAQQFGAEFFANGANMGGVLTHPGRLTDDQIKRLKDSWNRSNAGLGKSNGTAVLEEGMKYERIGIPPDAAQFLQSRRFTVEDIARAFRVPPAMLAEMSNSSTRANVEEQAISFVRDTMNPYIARFETEFNRKLFREDELGTYYVRFTVDGLLRGDIKTRYSSYSIARQWGWLSVNDIRDLENLNPIEGGDTYLSPLNMAPVAESPSNLGEDAD
jgi:HK97 family phage portal protein